MQERKFYTPKERKKWTFRLSGLEGTFWFAFATTAYLSVYLDSLGYSVSEVSVISSIGSALSIISTTLGGTIGDKLRSPRRALNIFLFIAMICSIAIPLTSNVKLFGFPLFLIFVQAQVFFRAPTSTLMETAVINGCETSDSYYGFVRIWGTLLYVVMCLILGAIINASNAYITYFLFAIFTLPVLYFSSSIKEVSDISGKSVRPLKFREMPFGKLFKNPYFIAYMIFSIFNGIPQNTITSFLPYLIKDVGSNMGYIGYLQAYRAMFEVPFLLLSRNLEKHMSHRTMVILCSVFYGIQAILSFTVNSFAGIVMIMTFSGIASGFTQAGHIRFVLELCPRELQSTAQTIISSTTSIAGIIGNLIGGILIEAIGIKNFYLAVGLAMAVVIAIYSLSFVYIRKVLKVEFHDYSKDGYTVAIDAE